MIHWDEMGEYFLFFMLDGLGYWIFRFFSSPSVGSPFFVVFSVKVYPTLFWFFFLVVAILSGNRFAF
jgi:hypothetical protein